jgi:hypothetical protein
MKNLVAVLLVLTFTTSAIADERARWWNVFGGLDAASVSFNGSSYFRALPKLGIEAQFPFGLTLGNSFTSYSMPFGAGTVQRTPLSFRLGWNFFGRKLQVVARYETVSTSYSNYSSSSSDGWGGELLYKMPIAKNNRWFLNLGAGYGYVSPVTLQRDTGVPATSSDFSNALCSLFTLGLSSGCGNIFQYVTIPRSAYWNVGSSVSWVW